MNPERKYAGIAQTCASYGIGKSRLYQLIAAGEIVAVRYGARTLIDLASIDAYFERLPRVPAKRASEKAGA
jgi:excisionase family DNA binding protein